MSGCSSCSICGFACARPPVGRAPRVSPHAQPPGGERQVKNWRRSPAQAGNTQRISSPAPSPPRASTVPPACVTMCFTIASPSPVPREARARSARKKRSKSRVSSASWTPTPSSVPRTTTAPSSCSTASVNVAPGPGVADRVLGEVLRDDAHHPRPDRELDRRVALDRERRLPPGSRAPRARRPPPRAPA